MWFAIQLPAKRPRVNPRIPALRAISVFLTKKLAFDGRVVSTGKRPLSLCRPALGFGYASTAIRGDLKWLMILVVGGAGRLTKISWP